MTEKNPRFACPCCGKNEIDPRVEAIVEKIERDVGQRIPVASGYRCEKHNREVGGSETSSHLKGLASDLGCKKSRLRFMTLRALIRLGIHRIGIGKKGIHFDIDRSKDPEVAWLY